MAGQGPAGSSVSRPTQVFGVGLLFLDLSRMGPCTRNPLNIVRSRGSYREQLPRYVGNCPFSNTQYWSWSQLADSWSKLVKFHTFSPDSFLFVNASRVHQPPVQANLVSSSWPDPCSLFSSDTVRFTDSKPICASQPMHSPEQP